MGEGYSNVVFRHLLLYLHAVFLICPICGIIDEPGERKMHSIAFIIQKEPYSGILQQDKEIGRKSISINVIKYADFQSR
jgi:hypothetical protein